MAPSSVNPLPSSSSTARRIPTAEEVSLAGGVWAPTSAKRDKLGELKGSLSEGQETLDDVATEGQLLDLYFADGVKLIAKVTDNHGSTPSSPLIQEFVSWLHHNKTDALADDEVNRTELEAKLQIVSAKLSICLEKIPSDRCFRHVRDFLDADTLDCSLLTKIIDSEDRNYFEDAVTRFRLTLVKAAVDQIHKSWDILTKVSDSDIDRAAVKGMAMEPKVSTVSLSKVYGFLEMHATGTCSDRVSATWTLLDRDQDTLLDQEQMNQAVSLCLAVTQDALPVLFEEALEAFPVRAPLSQGWRQRRAENKIKKKLLRMFKLSCKNTFRDEVEINHRLRCIYAWADKADQDNKIESVLVDADGWSGRKRYVELSPKISETEFRQVQGIHLTHLNQIGTEIVKSFREDLWVAQGKGRERTELLRDSLLFLTVVSVLDFVILSL
jgi:hypothetical protein